MGKINARAKGANGEREFCRWLFDNFNIPMPQRNLEQVRSGGTDIIDFEPFFFEVKRCEKIEKEKWWRQVSKAKAGQFDDSIVAVVAFRQNSKPWEFLISAEHIGCNKGYIHINEFRFLEWAKNLLSELD